MFWSHGFSHLKAHTQTQCAEFVQIVQKESYTTTTTTTTTIPKKRMQNEKNKIKTSGRGASREEKELKYTSKTTTIRP